MTISSQVSPPATDRFLRQSGLVSTELLANTPVSIIGVGAIGRQLALQLAALGVMQIQLIDFDEVESHNVTSQGFHESDIGKLKVHCTGASMAKIDGAVKVETVEDRFRIRQTLHAVVFCCVDSITSRTAIWRHLETRTGFWADGRMLGEVMRILTATDGDSREYYGRSLFAASEAQAGACTSRSTIYTANIASGLMVHQFTRWIRGLPIDGDVSFNLLTSELSVE